MHIDRQTTVLVQGITGKQGRFHTALMRACGTQIRAGVTPGKGGLTVEGVPVFDTVKEALRYAPVHASIVFVPGRATLAAVTEAIEADIGLIVCITENVPVHDTLRMMDMARDRGAVLLGPNSPGLIRPGHFYLGIMPDRCFRPGHVGIVSRSGTLMYEAAVQMQKYSLGQSCCFGLGGDVMTGWGFSDALSWFHADDNTDVILMIGEIGGSDEEQAARWFLEHGRKPVAAYIAGLTAPEETIMGHAGAFVSEGQGSAASKIETLRLAGIAVLDLPTEMGSGISKLFCVPS